MGLSRVDRYTHDGSAVESAGGIDQAGTTNANEALDQRASRDDAWGSGFAIAMKVAKCGIPGYSTLERHGLIPSTLYDPYGSREKIGQSLQIKMIQKDQSMVTGRQIAAARSLVAIGQAELAKSASISVPTLKRMEANEGAAAGMANNVRAVIAALEAAGIEFIPANGGGPGVRLRDNPNG